ncbi:MAG: acyl-ACP--UDP-N-acetylglucosamine O-acyltransferase [Acidobacteria bacterium]|nr:acyl-ACP--UDP-N-acetylglucosamine O-acyltransferase [Acidobacteriota bacterium]
MEIHPTAIVSPRARLPRAGAIGPYSIIDDEVEIGEGTRLASHVVVRSGVRLGAGCRVASSAVLGDDPQDRNFQGGASQLIIGARAVIREHVTIHRSAQSGGATTVGSDSFLMAGVHVGHDARVGDHVTLANNVLLGGHVVIEDYATLGGGAMVHQFCRVGKLAMVGGNVRVIQDVPPFLLAAEFDVAVKGLNLVGLRRFGMPAEKISALKKAYHLLYRSKLPLAAALERIEQEIATEEAHYFVAFIRASERGICRE